MPFETRPVGPLGVIAMPGCEALGERIDKYLRDWREGIGEQSDDLYTFPGYNLDTFPFEGEMPPIRHRRGQRTADPERSRLRHLHHFRRYRPSDYL